MISPFLPQTEKKKKTPSKKVQKHGSHTIQKKGKKKESEQKRLMNHRWEIKFD